MKTLKWNSALILLVIMFLLPVINCFGNETLDTGIDDARYNKAIHIMAMLIAGFGFLMVFVKKYGRSALTATFLLVAISLPAYMLFNNFFFFPKIHNEIERLILAEFAGASLLIAAGAVLGRLKMPQYLALGLMFVFFYMVNEWIVVLGGLNIIAKGSVVDTGGSIVIHAFGAIFGLGVALTMTTKDEHKKTIQTDSTSDRYSMLGSMILWIFWPSFCAALVPAEAVPHTVVNVVLALCGSTLATYIVSVSLRGKINIADIANAALAGGVAIGSTCDSASYSFAIVIGILAGTLSTFGFAVIQAKQQKLLKLVDTCGVTNLHGLPGIFGGLAALPIVKGISMGSQFIGILITIGIALISGFLTGKILALFGRKKEAYEDAEEFMDAED
ncbi:MAG: ammonium transporter [Bacteroidetes bacterium RIFOXYA12_FULL_35_11]|nr:MAG: ammonium transporter [Bacteroidetes bacterium GWF2_35_48]OFY81135.1 MAG: ammonium transporter [Bacteroidetes bacterium RIFOXYA12_FULL_35_11]HBX49763.1 ammonium transporter [Bacteroidales bacterium]